MSGIDIAERIGKELEISESHHDWGHISTNLPEVDKAMTGGIPKGRVTEIYGPESCLAADTYIPYDVRSTSGNRQNHKGGSIERLFERFHGLSPSGDGRGKTQKSATVDSSFWVSCIDLDGRIIKNRIVDVVSTGVQECYEVKTSFSSIVATANHRFHIGTEYRRLGDLKAGDIVSLHDNSPQKGRQSYASRPTVTVCNHPNASWYTVENKYHYQRMQRSRAIMEASLNGMNLEQYVDHLKTVGAEGLVFIDPTLHVHHIDEDFLNNNPENLMLITPGNHGKLHAKESMGNLSYHAAPYEILSIEPVGERTTYDISMAAPHHNYVAANFVVHNSAKTTLTWAVIAQVQRLGETALFIDGEHAADPSWAEKQGVDWSQLGVLQPDNLEQALSIIEQCILDDGIDLVVLDSVAAMATKRELAGDLGDRNMGDKAFILGQECRRLASAANQTGTTVIFINQIREKLGVVFGSPETVPGGRAIKFAASMRIDTRKRDHIKDGETIIGSKMKIKVVKNKLGRPFQEAEYNLMFDTGIDYHQAALAPAIEADLVKKSGAWYAHAATGEKMGQGEVKAAQWLRENDATYQEILKGLR